MLENRNVLAWFLLVSAVAVHVMDEALTGFLRFWNQLVTNSKEGPQLSPSTHVHFCSLDRRITFWGSYWIRHDTRCKRDGKFM